MDERIDRPDPELGFTWIRTDESYYIRSDDGDLKRVSDAAFALLERIAAGEIAVDELDDETRAMITQLEGEYLRPGEPVVELSPPDDIALWPRALAFLALAAVGLFATIREWPELGRLGELLDPISLSLFAVLLAGSLVVHEFGHYVGSREYVDASLGFRTVNGVIPAFVMDTTEAWTLPKNRRRWINLAGPTFGLATLCPLLAVHHLAFPDSVVLSVLIVNVFLQNVLALNPFVHGDGYFLLMDTFGLVNFRERGREDFRSGKLTKASAYVVASYAFGVLLMSWVLYIAASAYGRTAAVYVLGLVAVAHLDLQRVKAVLGRASRLGGR